MYVTSVGVNIIIPVGSSPSYVSYKIQGELVFSPWGETNLLPVLKQLRNHSENITVDVEQFKVPPFYVADCKK